MPEQGIWGGPHRRQSPWSMHALMPEAGCSLIAVLKLYCCWPPADDKRHDDDDWPETDLNSQT